MDATSLRPQIKKDETVNSAPPDSKIQTLPRKTLPKSLGEFSGYTATAYTSRSLGYLLLPTALLIGFIGILLAHQLWYPAVLQAEAGVAPFEEIVDWDSTTPLLQPVAGRSAILSGDTVYLFGGRDEDDGSLNTIYAASIQGDGTLGAWTLAGTLPKPLYLHATVLSGNFVYVIGGWNANDPSSSARPNDSVWRGEIASDGTIGNWVTENSYPLKVTLHQAVVVNQRIFVMGGYANVTKVPIASVYYADIDAATGTLGPWQPTKDLPQALRRSSATTTSVNGTTYIYVTGGSGEDTDSAFKTVYYSAVAADGSLSDWQSTTQLPDSRRYHAAAIHDGRLVVLGGINDAGEYDTVYSAIINSNGTLGSWTPLQSLPTRLHRFAAVTINKNGSDYIMVLGGFIGDSARDEVYYSTIPVLPTPVPTATNTPEPTPTPLPQLEVAFQSSPDGWVAPGEQVEYTVDFYAPTEALNDVEIETLLPPNMELVLGSIDADDGYDFTVTETGINWQIGNLQGEESGQVSYTLVRPAPVPPSDNTPRVLQLTLSGPQAANGGELIEYTLELQNRSVIVLPDITVRNTLPFGATYIDGSGDPPTDGEVVWNLPVLSPLGTETFTYTVVAETTLFNNDYQAESLGGPNAIGYIHITTEIGNRRPIVGDSFKIVHDGVQASWQAEGNAAEIQSDLLTNPSFQYYLPLQNGGE